METYLSSKLEWYLWYEWHFRHICIKWYSIETYLSSKLEIKRSNLLLYINIYMYIYDYINSRQNYEGINPETFSWSFITSLHLHTLANSEPCINGTFRLTIGILENWNICTALLTRKVSSYPRQNTSKYHIFKICSGK